MFEKTIGYDLYIYTLKCRKLNPVRIDICRAELFSVTKRRPEKRTPRPDCLHIILQLYDMSQDFLPFPTVILRASDIFCMHAGVLFCKNKKSNRKSKNMCNGFSISDGKHFRKNLRYEARRIYILYKKFWRMYFVGYWTAWIRKLWPLNHNCEDVTIPKINWV